MPNTPKWIEVSSHPSVARFECLADQMKDQGLDTQFESFQFSSAEEWQKTLEEQESQVEGIRLGRGLGEGILEYHSNHSAHIHRLGAADCLVKADQKWWPRSACYDGLLQAFSNVGEKFDLNSSALIVGAGAMARTTMAVLFREGFKRFGIAAVDTDRGRRLVEDLKKVYFGADIEFIPKDELILLPGLYGVIVNTTPSTSENELLNELSYFNFFIPHGVALDLFLEPAETDFLKEAREIGATVIPGYEVAAAADQYWAKWTFDLDLDMPKYVDRLKQKFQSKV